MKALKHSRKFDRCEQQLKERAAKAGKGALADAIAALDKQAAELEGQPKAIFSACSRREATGEFFQLEPAFRGHPFRRGQCRRRTHDAGHCRLQGTRRGSWETHRALVENPPTGYPALNLEFKKAELAPVDSNRTSDAAPSTDADGDDEP